MSMFADLSAEFPQGAIHWRAQSVTKDGDKAMALAYIDARNVMERLDEVCGPAGWTDSYMETPKGRLICTLSILVDGVWISKSDGAGDTDVEGDKGAISDALKRAAVKWGIGRYLYDMPTPWVPCESYEKNGKRHWKKWAADPWAHVRNRNVEPKAEPKPDPIDRPALIMDLAKAAGVTIQTICESYSVSSLNELPTPKADAVIKRLNLTIADKKKENA
jgi:hypothetical protein